MALIISGAEFALIPSRDEPFGLVAVEFGRKGALGIGGMIFEVHANLQRRLEV